MSIYSDIWKQKLMQFFLCSILSWNDSISSLKATLLMGPMVRYMAAEQILNSSLASNLMIAVLQAFQVHGQHDANVVSGGGGKRDGLR